MLDDDSLVAFKAIPGADRDTLPRSYAQMNAIFDPPSNATGGFCSGGGGKPRCLSPSTVHCCPWGKAAYPHMDWVALDSLALKRLLSLVQELSVALHHGGGRPHILEARSGSGGSRRRHNGNCISRKSRRR
ncbi:unnamed protein product [Lampetra planeri]